MEGRRFLGKVTGSAATERKVEMQNQAKWMRIPVWIVRSPAKWRKCRLYEGLAWSAKLLEIT